MPLAESVFATDRTIQVEVFINGELLASGLSEEGSNEEGNLTGIDIGFDIEQLPPSCTLAMVTVPSWVKRGHRVEVNAGYDGELTRVFTGMVKRRRHTPRGHSVDCIGRTSKLTRPYRTRPAKGFLNIAADAALVDVLDDSGVNFTPAFNEQYEIDATVGDWTIGTVQAAYMDTMAISDMIRKIADVDGNRAFETRSGLLRVRPLLEWPAESPFRTYVIGGSDTNEDTVDSFSDLASINTDDALGDAAARTRRSQGWTPAASGAVGTVSLFLQKVGNPVDSVYFELYADDGTGLPGTTLLGGSGKYNGQLLSTTDYTEVPLRILSGSEIIDGTPYHIVVRRTGANSGADYYVLGRLAAGGYTGGAPARFNGTIWVAVTGDHPFTAATTAFATGRITNISDDEDEDQVKKRVTVRGAAIIALDTEGNEITTQVEQTASTQSDDLVVGDPELFSMTYANDLIQDDAKAAEVAIRLLNKFHRILNSIEVEVPFDPEVDLALTVGIDDQEVTNKTGNWWVRGYRHSLSASGASTSLSLFGGDQGGTQGCVSPRADFTYIAEKELIGNAVHAVITFDASTSMDEDGIIVNYRWQDDYAGGAMDQTGADLKVITVSYDSDVDEEIEVTLTVTDNGCGEGTDGLTNSITKTFRISAENSEIYVPIISCAAGNTCMATFDGAQSWEDIATPSGLAKVTAITSNPFEPQDPVIILFGTSTGRIYRSIDAMATLVLEYTDADGDAITDIAQDKDRKNVVWATTTDRVLRSVDYGNTWQVWTNFNDATKWPLAEPGGDPIDPRPVNGILVSTPAVNRVWIFGGRGNIPGSWFHTNYLPDGGAAWYSSIAANDGPGAVARNSLDTVVDAVVSHQTSGDLGLIFERTGGGVPANPYIYSAKFYPRGQADWQIGGGAMVDVGVDGVSVAMNNLQLQKFGAVLNNKNFYVTHDGINWWPWTGVLPGTAGNRPHHLLNTSAWQDIYLAAMDEGVAKSIDYGETWNFLRPIGAPFSTTWPAGAIGYKVAIAYRLPTSVDLAAIVTSGAGDTTVETALAIRTATGGWVDMGPLPTGRSDNPHRLWYFPSLASQPYFFIRYTDGGAFDHQEDLYRSIDGTTWTMVLDKAGAIALAADGTLWATAEPDVAGHTFGFQAHGIYRSTDDGATWTLVYTDPTQSADQYTQFLNLDADPNDPNRLMAAGQFPASSIRVLVTVDATAITPSFSHINTGLGHEGIAAKHISPKLICGQNHRWMIGFQVGGVATDRIYTSDNDGLAWTKRLELSPGGSTFGWAQALRAGMNIWFVGSMAADGLRAYLSKDNGTTWDAQTAPDSKVVGVGWNSALDILFITTKGSGTARIQYMLLPTREVQFLGLVGTWLIDPVSGLETAMGYTEASIMNVESMQVRAR